MKSFQKKSECLFGSRKSVKYVLSPERLNILYWSNCPTKQKGLRKNIFNLDEDAAEGVLTHKGAALSTLDLRDDYHDSDPDDDGKQLSFS